MKWFCKADIQNSRNVEIIVTKNNIRILWNVAQLNSGEYFIPLKSRGQTNLLISS